MTWIDLKTNVVNLIYQNPKRIGLTSILAKEHEEVVVYFDFPTDGRNKKWKISKVTEEGIMLYNDEVQRPLGH